MQRCGHLKNVFLSPDAETWDPYSKTYALNKEQLVDASGDIVYPPPRAREVFKPMEIGEVRTEPLDNMIEQLFAYDKVVDAVIYSSDVVLDFPQSIERLVVTDPIRAQVASISMQHDCSTVNVKEKIECHSFPFCKSMMCTRRVENHISIYIVMWTT